MSALAQVLRRVAKDLVPADVHVPTTNWPRKKQRKLAQVLLKLAGIDAGLYVGRRLTPECDARVRAWAAAQGLPALDPNLHVTVVYSRAELPWDCAQGTVSVPRSSFRGFKTLGAKGAVVLAFRCPSLHSRWSEARRGGATWDYGSAYTPHLTLYYGGPVPTTLPPFPLEFGPEVCGGLEESVFKAAFDGTEHPRDAHGQFVHGAAIAGPLPKGEKRSTVWLAADGTPLDATAQAHLAEISGKGFNAPNYTQQTYYAPDPARKGTYVGTVIDGKGRSKRFYLDDNEAAKYAVKTQRVRSFATRYDDYNRKLDAACAGKSPSHDALALRLLTKSGMRPGSDRDTGAEAKAFGATNMPTSACTVKGTTVLFKFPAKNGKTYTTSVQDGILAAHVVRQQRAGAERLFDTNETKVRALFKHLTGDPQLQLKDIRTAHGTAIAQAELNAHTFRPTTEKEFAQLQKEISTKVAAALQNTPKVALEKYILDGVWHGYRPGGRLLKTG